MGQPTGLAATVDWYRDNAAWWRAARDAAFDDYYARQYGDRLAGSTAAEGPVGDAGAADEAVSGPAAATSAAGTTADPA